MFNKDSFALITGATSGIGEACAKSLARLGKNLILIGRRVDKLQELKKDFEVEFHIQVLIFSVDVQKLEQIENLFKKLKNTSIDILINNAGLARGKENFETYPWADFEEMINTNIIGFLKVAQLSIPFLKKTKGHIVNISSIAASEAYEGGSVYCASKAFVKMISKSLRIDLLGTGIRVTDIAPGAVDTKFSEIRFHGDKQKADSVYQGFVPLHAEDIADTVTFALTRPAHVNLDTIVIYPTDQASITRIFKK